MRDINIHFDAIANKPIKVANLREILKDSDLLIEWISNKLLTIFSFD